MFGNGYVKSPVCSILYYSILFYVHVTVLKASPGMKVVHSKQYLRRRSERRARGRSARRIMMMVVIMTMMKLRKMTRMEIY